MFERLCSPDDAVETFNEVRATTQQKFIDKLELQQYGCSFKIYLINENKLAFFTI